MRKNRLIYSITNLITNEIYIGQNRVGVSRWNGHLALLRKGERTHNLYKAMRKYGVENFEFSELCCALKVRYLNELEVHFIREYDSFNHGYNMTCGGEVSEATRDKLSRVLTGRSVTWVAKGWITRRASPNYRRATEYVAKGADNPNARTYKVRLPSGEEQIIKGLNQFCKDHGLTKKSFLTKPVHRGYSLLVRFND